MTTVRDSIKNKTLAANPMALTPNYLWFTQTDLVDLTGAPQGTVSKTLNRMVRDGELEIRASVNEKGHPRKEYKNVLVEAGEEDIARAKATQKLHSIEVLLQKTQYSSELFEHVQKQLGRIYIDIATKG